MSETIKGSFEWAIQQIKAGKRATRTGWCGQNMFILRNPGLVDQVVGENDFRGQAGVPPGTVFNYLPYIEICNAEGNYVPWTPSQVDIEAMDWATVDDDARHMLVVDITSGYYKDGPPAPSQVWGYQYKSTSRPSGLGVLTIIEDNIPLEKVNTLSAIPMFEYEESDIRGLIRIYLIPAEDPDGTIRSSIADKAIKFTVDGELFDLGLPSACSYGDYSPDITFYYYTDRLNGDREAFESVVAKLKNIGVITRYCLDWYDVD